MTKDELWKLIKQCGGVPIEDIAELESMLGDHCIIVGMQPEGYHYGYDGLCDDCKHDCEEGNDPVNHPSHYTDGKIEVIDFINDKKLGFELGNAVKYIARAGKKDSSKTIEDLQKAVWYVNHHISMLEAENENN